MTTTSGGRNDIVPKIPFYLTGLCFQSSLNDSTDEAGLVGIVDHGDPHVEAGFDVFHGRLEQRPTLFGL